VVGPNFERFLLSEQEADPLRLLVLQQLGLPNPTLLPLASVVVKTVELAFSAASVYKVVGGRIVVIKVL
jgi:hypothetical protein